MKKKISNELIGRTVMVHPHLTTDPIQRQGEIGKVVEVGGKDKDVLTVDFNDRKKCAYQSDGLLTLYPAQVILQALTSNQKMFTEKDQSRLLKIYQFTKEGKFVEALRLAKTNETTRFFATTTCVHWLEMKKEQNKNSKVSKGGKSL